MVASTIVALCALLAATVSAQQDIEYNKRVAVDDFWKRGASSSFQAPQDVKAGSSCGEAFGDGYVTCKCYGSHTPRSTTNNTSQAVTRQLLKSDSATTLLSARSAATTPGAAPATRIA